MVQSVAVVERDPAHHHRDYQVSRRGFAMVMKTGEEAGEGVWVSRLPQELLVLMQVEPEEPVGRPAEAAEAR